MTFCFNAAFKVTDLLMMCFWIFFDYIACCLGLKIHATASTKHLLESYKVFRFKSSPLSPVPVTDDLDVESYWLVDEEGTLIEELVY